MVRVGRGTAHGLQVLHGCHNLAISKRLERVGAVFYVKTLNRNLEELQSKDNHILWHRALKVAAVAPPCIGRVAAISMAVRVERAAAVAALSAL